MTNPTYPSFAKTHSIHHIKEKAPIHIDGDRPPNDYTISKEDRGSSKKANGAQIWSEIS